MKRFYSWQSTLLTSFITLSSVLIGHHPVAATEFILRGNCSLQAAVERLPIPGDNYDYDYYSHYRRRFVTQGRTYWFYQARYYGDAAALFCVSLPNFQQPQVIQDSRLNGQLIHRIIQQGDGSPVFHITVIHAQNVPAPANEYRLDLSNPQRPRISEIASFTIRQFDD